MIIKNITPTVVDNSSENNKKELNKDATNN
jgi:hypothetical protein